MINPGFPAEFESQNYILNKELINKVASKNSSFDTEEIRFEDVFTFEIWEKLANLGIKHGDLDNLDVLYICAGSGYLSYHLLKKCQPKKLTLLDISQIEINHAQKTLSQKYPEISIEYSTVDFLNSNHQRQYDVVIGNSFLHHFYNVPEALAKINKMLKPGGIFIALHEPTVASFALESRNPLALFRYIAEGKDYIEFYRKIYSVSPYDGVSGDVWLFTTKALRDLFNNAGFINIKLKPWALFRSITAAYLSFFPNFLNYKSHLLKMSIILDRYVSYILPDNFLVRQYLWRKRQLALLMLKYK